MRAERPVVCVVGAGPAGLVVAHLLRQAGIPFVLLERHDLAETIRSRGRPLGVCEFRADGEAYVLDYAALCDGRGHVIYPQHELVGDWCEQLVSAGGDLRFGVRATGVEQHDDEVVVDGLTRDGAAVTVRCEALACCDGAASAFAEGVADVSISYPFRWLTLIAAVPPASRGTIYGLHRRGFAGQMHRSPTMTRFMLEVPATDGLDDWPDDRIWAELEDRLTVRDRPPIERGELVERDVLDHRVRMYQPMQDGRVFFAGDAAHLITPAGGKGMNIAIQDAAELAAGLCERFGEYGDGRRLDRYSETRLPSVWRQQEFSNVMLSLFNARAGADGGSDFVYGLRRARLDQIVNDARFSRWFAHAYAGVDE